jgi:outer membrane protein TolC
MITAVWRLVGRLTGVVVMACGRAGCGPALALGLVTGVGIAAGAEPISWEAAVAEAARAHPELRAAAERLRAAAFRERSVFGNFLPNITGSAAYTESHSEGAATSANTTQSTAALTASQNLFAGFRDRATLAQAVANREAAAIDLEIAKARVSAQLKSAFAALAFAEDNVRLARDIIRRREENLRLVELRYESGRENKGSYLLSRAALAQARFDLLQAEQALALARQQLARALGRGSEAAAFEIAGAVPSRDPPENVDFLSLARATPVYRRALAEEQAAREGIGVARAALLPSLDLSGTLARQGENGTLDERVHTVRLNLSIPLYSGGRDYYGLQSAAALYSAAQANRESIERSLIADLKDAYYRYVQAVEKLHVDEEFLTAARTRAEIARQRYDNGLVSFEDWDIIENDLVARQKQVLASRRVRLEAEAAWEQTLGVGAIP